MNLDELAERIFEDSQAIPANERNDYYTQKCGNNTPLRKRVEQLNKNANKAAGMLDRLSDRVGISGFYKRGLGLSETRRVGAYELVQEIGSGGMGSVFLGRRADEQFVKQVAIKILPVGLKSQEMEKRFRAETQILASLIHPNIARLLDAGFSEQGTPYLVMDYIDGLPLDVYCDKHCLGVRARIKLFIDVCSAVHYAHSKNIVHRDIKPNNILVETDGQAKLLDFGIAKNLSDAGAPTVASKRMFTPLFASPESIKGESASPLSDIYSLGALLHHLLCGFSPAQLVPLEHSLQGTEFGRASENLKQYLASNPSLNIAAQRNCDAKSLVRSLRGELDSIITKAMHPTRQERYNNAIELKHDLNRYLAGEFVRSKPKTLRYVSRKAWSKNRTFVLLFTAVTLIVAAGFSVIQIQVNKTQERLIAELSDARIKLKLSEQVFRQRSPMAEQALQEAEASIIARQSEDPILAAKQALWLSEIYLERKEPRRAARWHAYAQERATGSPESTLQARLDTLATKIYSAD